MSDMEAGGLDRAGRLALASPYSRGEWGLALGIMGSMADDMLPTVHELCALGWAPSAAAYGLLKALDPALLNAETPPTRHDGKRGALSCKAGPVPEDGADLGNV